MKKFYLLFMLIVVGMNFSFAQNQGLKPEVAYPVYFDISPPLRDMIKVAPGKVDNSWKDGIVKNKFNIFKDEDNSTTIPNNIYSKVQNYFGMMSTDTTIQNFDGVNNVSGYNPPDTHGDVGKSFYFQVVNCSYAVYNKSGVKVLGPFASSTVWNGMPNNSNDGDAVILYDEIADRWIFTQFSLPSAGNFQMIAVSQTNDPTGSWYRYQYSFTAMPDYPKFGIWPDGYYMSSNRFANGSSYSGTGADAYDRTAMLSGSPTAARVSFTLPSSNEAFTAIPADCDGPFPPLGTPEYFVYIRTSGSQHLGINEFHTDWVTPANSTYGNNLAVPVASFNSSLSSGIPQKGTSAKAPAITDRLMYRVQYRTFADHNSIVTNHVVNAGSGVAGCRWYELRNSATDPWSIYQQSTYAPADNNSRWMGSIAMDSLGNIALGFSISSANMYPSIRYTGRMVCDTLGVMTIAEKGIMNGGGAQTATGNMSRWGDYSAMSADPSEHRKFWYTQEYYSSTSSSNWRTRIASFSFFSASAFASPTQVCAGDSAQLNVLANCGAPGNYTYQWSSIPAGFTSTAQTPKVAPVVPTKYVVSVSDGNNTHIDTVMVDVMPQPIVSAGADTTVCWYLTSIHVSGTAVNVNSINWTTSGTGTFDNSQTFSTNYHPTLADKLSGSVNLGFVGTPTPPCTKNITSTKHVIFDVCTGMANNSNNTPAMVIQPNPAHGNVSIGVSGINGLCNLTITSMEGKNLFTDSFEAATTQVIRTFDISAYPRGIYFVQLRTGSKVITEKMIVQ
ncbi:MAG: T9SS type A sorting domain-containing protein [Bacteroidota bacterium]